MAVSGVLSNPSSISYAKNNKPETVKPQTAPKARPAATEPGKTPAAAAKGATSSGLVGMQVDQSV